MLIFFNIDSEIEEESEEDEDYIPSEDWKKVNMSFMINCQHNMTIIQINLWEKSFLTLWVFKAPYEASLS